MLETIRPRIEQLHSTPHKTVLAVSGAGTQAVAWLLGVSGASRTILEVVVPYGRLSMQEFLGFEPAQSAAAATARHLARRCHERARLQLEDDSPAVGLACAATIATDRPKRGDHRAFVSALGRACHGHVVSHLPQGPPGQGGRRGDRQPAHRSSIVGILGYGCGTRPGIDCWGPPGG